MNASKAAFEMLLLLATLQKGFATVDMVLWDDTLVTASYVQYNAHGVATGTTEYATRVGS